MEDKQKSETLIANLRRSERLKAKIPDRSHQKPESSTSMEGTQQQSKKIQSRSAITPTTVRQNQDQRKPLSVRSSSTAIKRNQIEMEIAIRKKELEYKHMQEILDMELAMKLGKIGEEEQEETGNFELIELESRENQEPNIKKLIAGQCPWEDRSDYTSYSSSKHKSSRNRSDFQSSYNFRSEEDMVSQPSTNYRHFEKDKSIQNKPNNSCVLPTSQLTKILVRQSVPRDLPIFSGNPIEWSSFIFQY